MNINGKTRYCTACGARNIGGTRFCTVCGTEFEPDRQQVVAKIPEIESEPEPRSRRHWPIILGIVALILVAAGVVIAVALPMLTRTGEPADRVSATDRTVYYTDTELDVTRRTKLIAYGLDGEPLTSYRVTLQPSATNREEDQSTATTDASGEDWSEAVLPVDNTDGFSFSEFDDVPDGTYGMVIEQTGKEQRRYRCPNVRLGDGLTNDRADDASEDTDASETIALRPDPDNPDGAILPTVTYTSRDVTMDANFVYHRGDTKMEVNTTWSYVQFDASDSSGSGSDRLNNTIEDVFNQELNDAKAWDSDTASDPQCVLHTEQVTFLHGSVASVRTERRLIDWNNYFEVQVSGTLYDLDTGTVISTSTFANMTATEMQSKAVDAVRQYVANQPEDEATFPVGGELDNLIADETRYYIADEGLIVAIPVEESTDGGDDVGEGATDKMSTTVREIVMDGLGFDTALSIGTDVHSLHAEGA